ncbi:MAG: hypothetical protein IT371_28460 [Deltaproteobacteria bacterium]|nr:hypothetical protein [Deltaproteobacteria bacterium]
MIAKELRIVDIDPQHLANLYRLVDPPGGSDTMPPGFLDRLAPPPPGKEKDALYQGRQRPVLAFTRRGQVLRVVQLGGGTLPATSLRSAAPTDLKAFRTAHNLPLVVAVDVDELPGLLAQAQNKVRLDEDLVAQALSALRVLSDALGGAIHVEPRLWEALPIPPYELLQATFDRLLPDDRSFVFYVVDRGRIWTSLIVRKRQGDIDLVTTHLSIAEQVPFSTIRQDAPKIVAAVTKRFAPPHAAIFVPLGVWHQLLAGDRSIVARSMAARQTVIDPAPPWLLAIVGGGAVSEAATRSAQLVGKFLSSTGIGGRLFSGGAEKLVQTMANPLEALGLDPWELLRWARDWARRIRLDHP